MRAGRPRSRRPLPAGFATIWITVAIDLVGFGIVLPILPIYAKRFHTTALQATLLVAAFSAASFVCSPLWGRVSDRFGRKPVLLVSLAGTAVGSLLTGLAGGLFAVFISAFNPSAWTPQELLLIYAAILVGGRGNPRGVVVGVFLVYIGFIELTRFLPSPASRPEFGPAVRQILIGLLIILMLKFRPEGLLRERPSVDGRAPAWGRFRRAGAAAATEESAEVAAVHGSAGDRQDAGDRSPQ